MEALANACDRAKALCQCSSFEDGKVYDKPRSPWRWTVLILACLMLIGSYFCFDLPAACKTQIESFMGYPDQYESYFSLLYTLYAIPNIVLPFFGGYFVDKLGVRLCLMIFACLVAAGQVVFSFGLSIRSWPIMFIGRFIFGLGGESLTVANSALLADWFKGKELAFAFGVNLSIARLGSVINNIVSPSLTVSTGLVFACWFGAIVCAGSVLCVVLTLPIDKAFDDRLKLQTTYIPVDMEEDAASTSEHGLLRDEPIDISAEPVTKGTDSADWRDYTDKSEDVFNRLAQDEQRRSVSSNKAFTNGILPSSGAAAGGGPGGEDGNGAVKIEPSFWDVLRLPQVFWLLCLLCFVIYGCVLPFNNIASSFLLERDYFKAIPADCALTSGGCASNSNGGNVPNSYCPASEYYQPPLPYNVEIEGVYYANVTIGDVDCTSSAWSDCVGTYCSRLAAGQAQSAVIMSIPYIISAVMSPFVGIFIDKFGYRAVISTISPMILVIVHSILAFSTVSPVGPMVGQGLAYTAFAAALWPSVPIVVVDRLTGLAFGVLTSVLNFGLAVIPAIVAAIYSDSGNLYIPQVEELFISLGVIGFAVGLYLNYFDFIHESKLNRGETVEAASSTDTSQYQPPAPLAASDPHPVNFNPLLVERLSEVSDVNSDNDFNSRRAASPLGIQYERPRDGVSYSAALPSSDASLLRRRHAETQQRSASTASSPSFGARHLQQEERKRNGSFTRYEEIHRGGGF